mmetsp:Transcript_36205/g.71265  ORF Transcript_36205/g.71265 Transcript_36205/m.71265 type:complete len:204 (-) Transcript_36205:58-669(-)
MQLSLEDKFITFDLPAVNQAFEGIDNLQLARSVHSSRLEVIEPTFDARANNFLQILLRIGSKNLLLRQAEERYVVRQPGLLKPHPSARDDGHLQLGPSEPHLRHNDGIVALQTRSPGGGMDELDREGNECSFFNSPRDPFLVPKLELPRDLDKRFVVDVFQVFIDDGSDFFPHGLVSKESWSLLFVFILISGEKRVNSSHDIL